MEKTYKVLFVDDEINVLNSLRRGLFEEPYGCLFASSGKEALEIMAKQEIAVVVSDMRMPHMTGLQLLVEVQALYPEVVCIILSGYTQLQQILTTINQVNIFKFITKPWKLEEEFKVVINSALDYYRVIEQNNKLKHTLETQNKAYQNILSRIDVTIAGAKRSTSLLGDVGCEIFDFNWQHFQKNKANFEQLLLIESYVYRSLVDAVLYDAKTLELSEALNLIYEGVQEEIAFIYDHQQVDGEKIEIYLEIAISIVKSLVYTFKEQFIVYDLNVIEGKNHQGQLTISLMTKNFLGDAIAEQIALDDAVKPLEIIKLEFISKIIERLCGHTNMQFGYTVIKERLIFVLTLKKV